MAAPSPPAKPASYVCSISLNWSDKIRLIGLPTQLTPIIRQAIQRGWHLGIQREDNYYGSHEFKLKGNPWYGNGDEAVDSRRVICHILIAMAQNGWNLIQASDVSKKEGDKDTMFFENATPDPQLQIFCISFNMGDRIRVIDAPSFMPYVKQAVLKYWQRGIQQEREYFGSLELKLSGWPFYPDGAEAVSARVLLNQILANIRALGFKLYGSIDLSIGSMGASGKQRGQDLESWYFRKVGPHWQ